MSEQPLGNDDPILDNDKSPDLLGRSAFAQSSAALIDNLRHNESSSVIALIGPWGAGKSSMLNMIRRRITPQRVGEDKPWLIVDFNPWYYSDLQSLQAGFFRELMAALPTDKRWGNARESISKIGKATAPLTSVLSITGLDPSVAIDKIADLIGGDHSVAALHASADDALRKLGQPVLMVLDDLDRLAPDELLMVFKLLRLTGRLKNVHYLISYDEDSLLDILKRTGLVGTTDQQRAVDYLEKMVQVRLDLPPLRDVQITAWLDQAITNFAEILHLDASNVYLDRLWSTFDLAMRRDLRTPRSIHRFLAQAQAFLPADSVDIDFEDYLAIAWMRSCRPLLFSMIKKYKHELVGGASRTLPPAGDKNEIKTRWVARLLEAQIDPEMTENIGRLLAGLFPRFSKDWYLEENASTPVALEPPRIGNSDYFDRYFNFGVPPDDVSDAAVRAGYERIVGIAPADDATPLEIELERNPQLVITKLSVIISHEPEMDSSFLVWLARHEPLVPADFELFGPHRQIRRMGGDAYTKLSPTEIKATSREVMQMPHGLSVLSDWLHFASRNPNNRQYSRDHSAILAETRAEYMNAIEERFYGFGARSPLDISHESWALFWDWYREQPEKVREFVKNNIMYGKWRLLDTVGRLVSTGFVSGTHARQELISGLELETVDDLVGLDVVYRNLREEIDKAESPPWTHHSVVADRDSRRLYALQVLRAHETKSGQ